MKGNVNLYKIHFCLKCEYFNTLFNILIYFPNKRRRKNKRSRTSLFLGGAVNAAQLGCFFFF